MELNLFKTNTVAELLESIPNNLEQYRSGDFSYLKDDATKFLHFSVSAYSNHLDNIHCTPSDKREVENALEMSRAFPQLSPHHARDERLWVRLTHLELLEYSRSRWPIPEDDTKAISHIKTHFFGTTTRGIERDNAASRLWWMAYVCSRVRDIALEESLRCFLYRSDVRANIIERPTTSLSTKIFAAVIKKLNESYYGDKTLFERDIFRSAMKELNLEGGFKLLDVLPPHELGSIIERCCQ